MGCWFTLSVSTPSFCYLFCAFFSRMFTRPWCLACLSFIYFFSFLRVQASSWTLYRNLITKELLKRIWKIIFAFSGKMSESTCHCDLKTESCKNRRCFCKVGYKRNTKGHCILSPGKLKCCQDYHKNLFPVVYSVSFSFFYQSQAGVRRISKSTRPILLWGVTSAFCHTD